MFRCLSNQEIITLKKQGCIAEDWTKIHVKKGFLPESVLNTEFAGEVKLGVYENKIQIEDGITKKSGISNSYISDCIIGDNTLISSVKTLVNYDIGDNVVIENVGTLKVSGVTLFGNGTEIEVLNEGGGRELLIYDKLSAQIAYLMVIYRHDKILIKKLSELIREYVKTKRSSKGVIANNSGVLNTTSVRNVSIGENVIISGALNIEEGTIVGSPEAPVFIGEGVIAKNFIIQSGSVIDGGAIITSTFVGQGVQIGKQFSSEGSAFFANCEAFHGEACSLFAGPYTVTHHKSSLLIAGMVSFFNAGSGTNQSNHMYKLGPLHQGIIERGTKTGSFSYMLWPCKVGPYSVIMDKHNSNFDTSDLPFSYLTVENGKSMITPAMNLFTVGTRRDSTKWGNRDKRKDQNKLDLINFEFLNPFIMGKVISGSEILRELSENTPRTKEYVIYNGINILRLMLKTTRKYYEMLIKIYIAEELKKQIGDISKITSYQQLIENLQINDKKGTGRWVDICGMYSSKTVLENLLVRVKNDEFDSIEKFRESFIGIFNKYEKYAWSWCYSLIESRFDINMENIEPVQLISIIDEGKLSAIKLNNMILKDAEKEFDAITKTGFGIDGDAEIKESDFQNVRGIYEENKFVAGLVKESEQIKDESEKLIMKLQKLERKNK